MIQKYKTGGLTWIDLVSPTNDEIVQITSEYNIHPWVARELTIPTLRPKVDLYADFIYLILHFPSIKRGTDGVSDQEVDFIVGKDFLITARYGEVDALLAFSKSFEVESVLEKGNVGNHAGYIFFAMLSRIYEALLHRLEGLKEEAAVIETEIFKGHEREMVKKISGLSRDLLDFKRATSLHREILDSFEIAAITFFGKDFDIHVRKIIGDYFKVENTIGNTMELARELRETNDSLLSSKQNQITQFLTVIAFIALPLSIITSLFQINTKWKPIIGSDYDFWIITGLQIFIAAVMYAYFKWKKWI